MNTNRFNILYKSLIFKETALANYLDAQSNKLRALFSDESILPFLTSDINHLNFYKEINMLIEIITIENSLILRELYICNDIIKKFTDDNEVMINYHEDEFFLSQTKLLNAYILFLNALISSNEYKLGHLKLEKNIDKDLAYLEHELLNLVNKIYELQKLLIQKLQSLYTLGLINNLNEKQLNPFLKAVDISVEMIKEILSFHRFESIYIDSTLHRKIISFIQLKKQLNLILVDKTDTTVINDTYQENGLPWLAKNVKNHSRG